MNRYVLSVAVILSLVIIGCGKPRDVKGLESGLPNDAPKVKGESGMYLAEGAVCADVQKQIPVAPVTSYTPGPEGTAKVFFFTRVAADSTSNMMYHRFSYYVPTLSGRGIWKEVHSLEFAVKYTNYRTWSYVNAYPGLWRADALGPDKKSSMKGFVFEVAGETKEIKNPVVDKSGKTPIVTLSDAMVCENIEKGQPVKPGNEFIAEGDNVRVCFWGKFKSPAASSKASIRWSRLTESVDGDKDFTVFYYSTVDIKGKEWPTYYWINCTPGEWKADVLAADESVIRSIDFTVKKAE